MTVALCPPGPGPPELDGGGGLEVNAARWVNVDGVSRGLGLVSEAREDKAEAMTGADKRILSCTEL